MCRCAPAPQAAALATNERRVVVRESQPPRALIVGAPTTACTNWDKTSPAARRPPVARVVGRSAVAVSTRALCNEARSCTLSGVVFKPRFGGDAAGGRAVHRRKGCVALDAHLCGKAAITACRRAPGRWPERAVGNGRRLQRAPACSSWAQKRRRCAQKRQPRPGALAAPARPPAGVRMEAGPSRARGAARRASPARIVALF